MMNVFERCILVFTVCIVTCATFAYQAEACSPIPNKVNWSYPSKDAKDVPINAAILMQTNANGWTPNIQLQNDKNEVVQATVTSIGSSIAVQPASPLNANAMYTIHCEGCFDGGTGKATFAFTTSDKEDKTEGKYAGAKSATSNYEPEIKPSNELNTCQGPRPGFFTITVKGEKQTGALMYELLDAQKKAITRSTEPTLSTTLKEDQDGKENCYFIHAIYPNGKSDGNDTKVCVTPEKGLGGVGCNQTPTKTPSLFWLLALVFLGLPRRSTKR